MNAYSGGGSSVQTGSAVPPRDSTIRTIPRVAPSVSASGFSWLTARTRRAPRSRATTSAGTASRYASRNPLVIVCPAGSCAIRPALARLRWDDRVGRLLGEIAVVRQSRDGCRQRLAGDRGLVGDVPGAQLVDELQDARAPLRGVVEVDVERRDPLDPQSLTQLVAHERHRMGQCGDGLRPLAGLADHAHPDLGVPQLPVRLDLRDRGEPHPRIGDLARDDAADLLPQQLIDPIRPLTHPRVLLLRRRPQDIPQGRPQGVAGEAEASTRASAPEGA